MAAELYQRLLEAGWIEQQEKRVEVTSKGWPDLPNAASIYPRWRTASVKRSVSVRNGTIATRIWAARWGQGLLQLFIQMGWLRTTEESSTLQVSSSGQREISKIAAAA